MKEEENLAGQNFQEIWKAKIPNKIKMFLWILYHQRTKTNHRRHRLGVTESPSCSICGHPREDITHIFFQCHIAKESWEEIRLRNPQENNQDFLSMEASTWMEHWKGTKHKAYTAHLDWGTFFPYCLWQIWKTRNRNVFERKEIRVSILETYGMVVEYAAMTGNCGKIRKDKKPVQVKWRPPRLGMMKLNIDGTCNNTTGPGGIGGVIRNHQGEWILGFNSRLANTSPLEAELKAIRNGIQLAIQHDCTSLEIESDATEALEGIAKGISIYDKLISDCMSLLSRLAAWEIRHVYREQNQLADLMAKEGMKEGRSGDIKVFVKPPVFAYNMLNIDMSGSTFTRQVSNNNSYSGRDVASSYFDAQPSMDVTTYRLTGYAS